MFEGPCVVELMHTLALHARRTSSETLQAACSACAALNCCTLRNLAPLGSDCRKRHFGASFVWQGFNGSKVDALQAHHPGLLRAEKHSSVRGSDQRLKAW